MCKCNKVRETLIFWLSMYYRLEIAESSPGIACDKVLQLYMQTNRHEVNKKWRIFECVPRIETENYCKYCVCVFMYMLNATPHAMVSKKNKNYRILLIGYSVLVAKGGLWGMSLIIRHFIKRAQNVNMKQTNRLQKVPKPFFSLNWI